MLVISMHTFPAPISVFFMISPSRCLKKIILLYFHETKVVMCSSAMHISANENHILKIFGDLSICVVDTIHSMLNYAK